MIPYDKEYGLRVKEGAKCNAGKSKGCWFNFPNIVSRSFWRGCRISLQLASLEIKFEGGSKLPQTLDKHL